VSSFSELPFLDILRVVIRLAIRLLLGVQDIILDGDKYFGIASMKKSTLHYPPGSHIF
jgi:hypothetical protein